jgi:hypothetical protein
MSGLFTGNDHEGWNEYRFFICCYAGFDSDGIASIADCVVNCDVFGDLLRPDNGSKEKLAIEGENTHYNDGTQDAGQDAYVLFVRCNGSVA